MTDDGTVYVAVETDWDHFRIVGIFTTLDEAIASTKRTTGASPYSDYRYSVLRIALDCDYDAFKDEPVWRSGVREVE